MKKLIIKVIVCLLLLNTCYTRPVYAEIPENYDPNTQLNEDNGQQETINEIEEDPGENEEENEEETDPGEIIEDLGDNEQEEQNPLEDLENDPLLNEEENLIENNNKDTNNNVDENGITIMSDEEREELSEKLSDISFNYIPDTYPKEGLLHKKKQFPGLQQTANETIPASYSSKELGYISPAKYQNPYGTCWAFAAVAAAEANYAKNHNKQLIDLSELHLSNYTYITGLCDDPLDLISDDGFIYGEMVGNTFVPSSYNDPSVNPGMNRLQLGGNQTIAEQIIASGVGFVKELNMPYPSDHYYASDLNLKDINYAYHTDYILKETNVFSMSEPNEIKKAIMKYGALTVSYLHRPATAEEQDRDDFLSYYGVDGKSYMGSVVSTESSNHAVTLIGWDNNYSVDHFGKDGYPKPQSKGAWLVKNSWDTDFGDDGCFYISYEDGSIINSEAFAYTIEEVGNNSYDIYQYDGAGATGGFTLENQKTFYEGAIYTAQYYEVLDSIGVSLLNAGVTYVVYVYKNITDDTDPTSGTLVYQKAGSSPIANAGYHTIPISQEIKFADGEKFSVVVKLTNPNGEIIIPTDVYSEELLWDCVEINNHEEPNQTFFGLSLDGMIDAYDSDPDNSSTMKIKAICKKDSKYHTITFNKNGHAESSYVPDPYTAEEGTDLSELYLPTIYDVDYWFVGWDQLLPETMPNHDIEINAIWEERKDVPQDLSVSLSDDDSIIISTNDGAYLDALVSYYDYRYEGENPYVEVNQGILLHSDNTTENTPKTYGNRVYYDSSTPSYYSELEKIDSTHVKVSAYDTKSLTNKTTDITVIAKGYKQYDASVTFTKLVPACPQDVSTSFSNGVLTVNSSDKTWLKAIKSVLLTETDSLDYDQIIFIPKYDSDDDAYYINYVDDHLEITIPKTINKYGEIQNIQTGHNYRLILSPRDGYESWGDSLYINDSYKVIPSISFDSLISTTSWTFKCANNKFYIESNNNDWLDALVRGDIGIIFYPSHTYYYSIKVKNDGNYEPIKRENGCVTISDADLKQCGIYRGTYNSIYFDTSSDYIYPSLYNTYEKTYEKYPYQEGYKLTYGKALEKMPTITLSEGDNGSLNIYSSNEQFLKNIMYLEAVNSESNLYSSYIYYPYDINDDQDNVENHITNNTLNIPNMGFDNGFYSFAIGSYGFVTDNLYFGNQLPYSVEFENITLLDVPADAQIVKDGDYYCLTSNTTAYIDAYDTMNAICKQEREYYKYSPKYLMGMGSAGSSYFIDKDFYSNKVSSIKARLLPIGQTRTRITVEVPGYKKLTKNLEDKAYIINDLDGIKVKTINKKVYLYPGDSDKLNNLLSKISYNNVYEYSTIGYISYGDNEEYYYDSKNWSEGDVERSDLTTGEDGTGHYLCIDLSDKKFFSNSLYTKEPFFVSLYLNSSARDNVCGAISFCFNKDQYFINYHDETFDTFMPIDDFPHYYVGKTVELVDPYNSTHAFDGWYTKNGTGNDWGEKVTSITNLNAASLADVKGDINLYAKWFTTEKNTLSGVTANLAGGEVEKGTVLVLSTSEPSAQIRYTTDNSAPTTSSTLYSEPIIITDGITIKANVFEDGKTSPSSPLTLTFTLATEQDDTGGVPNPSIGLWTSDLQDITYDPSLKEFKQFDLKVFHYKTLLTEGKDYTVKYANNKKAGTASLTITGKGSYAGTLTKTFEIKPLELKGTTDQNTVIELKKYLLKGNGKLQKPVISYVEYTDSNGKTYKLKNNTDYVVTFPTDSKTEGTYNISIQGKGNYYTDNPIEVKFKITNKTLAETFSISGLKSSYSYTGAQIIPEGIIVKSGKTELVKDTDYEITYGTNKEVGTGSITFTGKGDNYEGTLTKTFKITGTALSSCKLTEFEASVHYKLDGDHKIKQEITLTDRAGNTLEEDEDYEITYEKNDVVGTATMIITGKKGYTGTIKKTFKIYGQTFNAKTITVSGVNAAYNFTGSEITVNPTLTPVGGVDPLVKDTDYEVTYKANINAGTATITFKGIGQYTGSFSVKFKINKASLESNQFSGVTENQEIEYSKGGVKPVITSSLVLNKDYTIKYTNNTILNDNSNAKKITSVVLTGKGNYQGTVTIPFKIVQKDISEVTITVPDKVYARKVNAYKSTPTLTDLDGKKLAAGTDYDKTITYRYRYDTVVDVYDSKYKSYSTKLRAENELVGPNDIVPAGTVIKVTVNGIKNYKGSISTVYKVGRIDISKATVTIPAQYYSGKPVCPGQDELVVKIGKEIISNNDYYISSYTNNTAKGTASLTIKGKGDYCGEKTVKFTISTMSFGTVIRFYPNVDGVTGTMKDQIITKNTKLTKNSFKNPGYTFVGWTKDPSNNPVETNYINNGEYTYNPGDSGKMIKLYAIWQ